MTDELTVSPRGSLSVRNARIALAASVVLTLLLDAAPYGHVVGRPLVWISTLAHELGHGLTALAIGAEFERFVMHMDASGAAVWRGHVGAFGRAAIAAGGLLGPPLVAAICFVAARTERGARIALGVLAAFLVAVAVLFTRNLFGVVFVLGLAGLLAALARFTDEAGARVALAFFGVQLSLSSFQRSDYLFMEVAHTASGPMPSDVAQIASALWLPYWLWGGLIALMSLVLVVGGLWVSVGPSSAD